MAFNTVILKKGTARLTDREYKRFAKGDTILGDGNDPVELNRWDMSDIEKAKAELKKCKCSYSYGFYWDIEEYALVYCNCDSDGEFEDGSDFEFADDK